MARYGSPSLATHSPEAVLHHLIQREAAVPNVVARGYQVAATRPDALDLSRNTPEAVLGHLSASLAAAEWMSTPQTPSPPSGYAPEPWPGYSAEGHTRQPNTTNTWFSAPPQQHTKPYRATVPPYEAATATMPVVVPGPDRRQAVSAVRRDAIAEPASARPAKRAPTAEDVLPPLDVASLGADTGKWEGTEYVRHRRPKRPRSLARRIGVTLLTASISAGATYATLTELFGYHR